MLSEVWRLAEEKEGVGSRCWHRKILNSPPLMDTQKSTATYGNIPSEQNLRSSYSYSTTKDKRATSRWVGEAGTWSRQAHPTPHCQHGDPKSGGISQIHNFPLRSQRVVVPCQVPQPWGSALERQAPQTSGFENQQGFYFFGYAAACRILVP